MPDREGPDPASLCHHFARLATNHSAGASSCRFFRMTSRVVVVLRSPVWIVALAVVLTAGSCQGEEPVPEPQARIGRFELPTVVVSAEYPDASISFSVVASGPVTGLDGSFAWLSGDSQLPNVHVSVDVDIELRTSDGDLVPTAKGTPWCEGEGCLGDYVLTFRWSPDSVAERRLVKPRLDASHSSDPPSYPPIALSNVAAGAGTAVVLADDDVISRTSIWTAVRAHEGLDANRRIVVEIDGGAQSPVHLVTSSGTETLEPGASSGMQWQLAMPTTCAEGPCGQAFSIEMDPAGSTYIQHGTHWRLIDYGPGTHPVSVDARSEEMPKLAGYLRPIEVLLSPGETYEEMVRIEVPPSLLEDQDSIRSVTTDVILTGRARDDDSNLTLFTLRSADGHTLSGPKDADLPLPAIECARGAPCVMDVVVSASLSESASTAQTVVPGLKATTFLPGLLLDVSRHVIFVEVVEP